MYFQTIFYFLKMKKYIAEFIGTFILVFFGTGSVIVNEQYNNALDLIGISFAFGIVIVAIIYSLGSISGAHINPAVTMTLLIGKLIDKKDALFYMIAQFSGAIIASLLLHSIFPNNLELGATNPSGSIVQTFVVELVSSFVLMLTILGVTQKETKVAAGLVIGLTVTGLILFAGPISGGSFNPARSFAPAVISGNISNLWIYLSAPLVGSISALLIWNLMSLGKNAVR